MRTSSNVVLKGDAWFETINKLKPIIDTFYDVYVLAIAIGINSDKQIESLDTALFPDEKFEINRSMLLQNSPTLDLLFKSAMITTSNVDLSEDLRMELAFNDDARSEEIKNFNHVGFLTKFANYGVSQLAQKLTDDPLENIEAINKYIVECADGLGFDEFDLDELDISDSELGG